MNKAWQRVSFGELADFRNGLNFTRGEKGHDIKVVGVGDFQQNETLSDFSSTKLVTVEDEVGPDALLADRDLLFVRSNGNKALVGRCVLVSGVSEPIAFSGFTIRARVTSSSVDHSYLSKLVRSPLFVAHLHRLGSGSSINNLSQDVLATFSFALPPLAEQREIAELLRTWDEAIGKLDQLIQHRRSYYIGLRDRMIRWTNPTRRRLGTLVQPIVRKVSKPQGSYTAISIRSHGKGTFARIVADPSTVDMDELYVAREGDLIVNITFAWEGAIAIVPPEHDGYLVSHRFPTFTPMQGTVCPRYLRHTVRMPRFTYLLSLVSPGGAGRNRVLNKSDFLDLEIPSPDFGRQHQIGELLDTAEAAVTVTEQYREALNRQKRGLMQKLLTGGWRVGSDQARRG